VEFHAAGRSPTDAVCSRSPVLPVAVPVLGLAGSGRKRWHISRHGRRSAALVEAIPLRLSPLTFTFGEEMDSMASLVIPQVRELDTRDISAILTRLHVGRIAFARDGVIDIRPVHYVYSQGSIFGRTSHGARLHLENGRPMPVVFEVDEVESLHRWKSLLVRGRLHTIRQEDDDGEEWDRAVDVLRTLVRGALSDSDPTPERTVLFRISIEEITGRAMS
jgi:uncharacterized protein